MSVDLLRSTSVQISSTITDFDLPHGTPRDLEVQLPTSNSLAADLESVTSVNATEGAEPPPNDSILDTNELASKGFAR